MTKSSFNIDAPRVDAVALRQSTPFDAPGKMWLVLAKSPKPVRRAVELLSGFAARELHFDYPGYSAEAANPDSEAWLWTADSWDERTRAIGFCHMYQEDGEWVMGWVWMHPFERRRGHLTSAWPFLRERYGAFAVDQPSEAMKAFLAAEELRARGAVRG